MGLATPTSVMVGSGKAAQLGVLFRQGAALQSLSGVRVIAFDKTGTLTEGRPELTDLRGRQRRRRGGSASPRGQRRAPLRASDRRGAGPGRRRSRPVAVRPLGLRSPARFRDRGGGRRPGGAGRGGPLPARAGPRSEPVVGRRRCARGGGQDPPLCRHRRSGGGPVRRVRPDQARLRRGGSGAARARRQDGHDHRRQPAHGASRGGRPGDRPRSGRDRRLRTRPRRSRRSSGRPASSPSSATASTTRRRWRPPMWAWPSGTAPTSPSKAPTWC